jgi:hypothetical protein
VSRKQSYIVGSVIICLLLIIRAPASLLGPVLPPTLSASGFSGTIWHGSIAHASIELQGKPFALGRLSWTINPAGFVIGDLVNLDTHWGNQTIKFSAGLAAGGNIYIDDLSLSIDLSWMRKLIPLYIGGRLTANIETLKLTSDGRPSVADGRAVWENAVWRATGGDVSLGSYAIDLSTPADGVMADIRTLKGALSVDGRVQVQDSTYRIEADLSGPAARNSAFQDAIALFAIPRGSGYRIELSGTL